MSSRRLVTIVAMVVWCAVALTAWARVRCPHTVSFAVRADEEVASSCADLHVRFDHREAIFQSEERRISKTEAPNLRVTAESNGGIQVEGWDQDSYGVTLCKAVEEGSDPQATLDQIHLSFQNGELGVTGPSSHERWAAHLLIRAPKAATMDVSMNNGPLTLSHVDGRLKVQSQNGPVTVSGCSGELDLTSQNGPLTLEENSGKQNIETHNGPVTLALAGDSWNGEGLEAHATNGPITLRIPSGYRSGVLLESNGHSPFECRASVCAEGHKTWEEDSKRIEFGSGPTVVHVSTVNGPVSVH